MQLRLGDIAQVIMGQSPQSQYFNSNGHGKPFLQGNRTFGSKFPTYDTFTTAITKLGHKNSVVMSVRAPVGELNVLSEDTCLGRGVCALNLVDPSIDPDFLFYALKGNSERLKAKQSGTVFGSINKSDIESLILELPDKAEWNAIAKFLGDIDRKILVNEQINKNLEQQIQEIFRSRFLTPGPSRDGWKKTTLADVSLIGAGGDKPKTVSAVQTTEYPYPIYSNGIRDEGLYGFSSGYKIEDESITVSARGTIGYVCLRHRPYTPIVRLITLVPKKEIVSAKYLYLWLRNSKILGTGTTQQQLTVPDFQKTEIVVPTAEEMNSFTDVVSPLFETIWANQAENLKLANLRDILLPKLFSGELDISNIEL